MQDRLLTSCIEGKEPVLARPLSQAISILFSNKRIQSYYLYYDGIQMISLGYTDSGKQLLKVLRSWKETTKFLFLFLF